MERLEAAGCLTPLHWRAAVEVHRLVADAQHVECRLMMLLGGRLMFPRDISRMMCGYICTRGDPPTRDATTKRIKRN